MDTIYRDGVKELRDLRDKGKARVAAGETVIDGEFLMLLHRPKSTAPVPIVVPAQLIREGNSITAAKASEGMGLSILASNLTCLAIGGGSPVWDKDGSLGGIKFGNVLTESWERTKEQVIQGSHMVSGTRCPAWSD